MDGDDRRGEQNDNDMEPAGKRIKKLRTDKGLTQTQVAAAIGIAQTSLKDIETGASKNPAALTLIKLAKFFEVDSEWLLTGKGARNTVATFTAEEVELLLMFRAMSAEAQQYLLSRARRVHEDEHRPKLSTASGEPLALPPPLPKAH